WTDPNGVSEWQIEYGPTGFTKGTGTLLNVFTNPYNLTSLNTYQTYDFYVRAICAVGDSSAWSSSASFTVGLPLNGNYTIDSSLATSGSNFQSISDFASISSLVGVSGAVNVDVVIGSGPYNQQVVFGDISGVSNSNSITLNGNGETVVF